VGTFAATEFGKLAREIWKNLLQKTVAPIHGFCFGKGMQQGWKMASKNLRFLRS